MHVSRSHRATRHRYRQVALPLAGHVCTHGAKQVVQFTHRASLQRRSTGDDGIPLTHCGDCGEKARRGAGQSGIDGGVDTGVSLHPGTNAHRGADEFDLGAQRAEACNHAHGVVTLGYSLHRAGLGGQCRTHECAIAYRL